MLVASVLQHRGLHPILPKLNAPARLLHEEGKGPRVIDAHHEAAIRREARSVTLLPLGDENAGEGAGMAPEKPERLLLAPDEESARLTRPSREARRRLSLIPVIPASILVTRPLLRQRGAPQADKERIKHHAVSRPREHRARLVVMNQHGKGEHRRFLLQILQNTIVLLVILPDIFIA
ncbi:hypothetical protein [Adlercreutzia faecimuris]|uniref:Uncharacterized protein n=1 Tax=Adlercreutzia faecimuris TaxID=2897341 RepID=A0ABS9WHE4_9ACTN|nr:hypothetical protein [Adlercreutzia sp. JBNU-10]MCI2242279.1 hypothetical protein [Adlercreutzia sp. JBNU-10]